MALQKVELIHYAEIIVKRRRFIISLTLVGFVLAVVISLLLPTIYRSTALVLPPVEKDNLMSGLLNQIGGFGAVSQLLGSQGGSPDLYVSLLDTEVIKNKILASFKLDESHEGDAREDLYKLLEKKTLIETNRKDGIISISVDDQDPEKAAAMTNAYVAALEELTSRLQSQNAGQNRIFLEQQLVNAKNSLNEAEEDLKIFQQKNKAFDVGEQGKASIETIANLQAQLVANEIRLATLSQRMTESNPEIRSTKSTIDQIKYQISEMEGQGGSSAIPSVGSMPSIGQQYGRLLRELKVRAAVVELLTSQYEMAHLAEANYVAGLRIVQQAQVPEKKLRPRRTRIVLLSTYMAFIFSVLGSFFQERVACLPPERKERWRSLGYRLRGR